MTLGKSLAHAIAKKNIRESYDVAINKAKSYTSKPGKRSRAAYYRHHVKTLKEIYKEQIYWQHREGNGSGKNKNEYFAIRIASVAKHDLTNEKLIAFVYLRVDARCPNIEQINLFSMSEHTLARINQTYHIEYDEIIEKLEYMFSTIESLRFMYQNQPWNQDKTYAVISELGAFICEYNPIAGIVMVKTIISYESMNSPIKAKFEKAENKDKYWIEWKKQNTKK